MTELHIKQYAAELAQLENAPPAAIELAPLEAIAIISIIQLGNRHPSAATNCGLTKMAISVALPLEIGAEAPEFLSCQGNWNEPVPAVDHNGNKISIKDFDGKCLALFFTTEARDESHRQSTMKRLEMMKGFSAEYAKSNIAFVAAGTDDIGMMTEFVKEAEINFPYIPLNLFSPMVHEYNVYTGITSAITYVICDGKIHQSWDMNYPKKYDETHFEEVLAYIAANNLA